MNTKDTRGDSAAMREALEEIAKGEAREIVDGEEYITPMLGFQAVRIARAALALPAPEPVAPMREALQSIVSRMNEDKPLTMSHYKAAREALALPAPEPVAPVVTEALVEALKKALRALELADGPFVEDARAAIEAALREVEK